MIRPGYAVIFSYVIGSDLTGYEEMDAQTLTCARLIPGYLGYESVKQDGRSIFISYWSDLQAIEAWRRDPVHLEAKQHGKQWYASYNSMICKVETAHFYNPDEKSLIKW
jgi:heme-degrading monooxygenase HmoA